MHLESHPNTEVGKIVISFSLIALLVLALPSSIGAFAQSAASADSGELLVQSDTSIKRSFSYPIAQFQGETTTLTVTIIWDTNGNAVISDNRGYSYTINIPVSEGTFSLWSNSTVVDQKFVGTDLQYDVFWTPVVREKGDIEKYKYSIVGTSANGTTLSFAVNGGDRDTAYGSKFVASPPASTPSIDKSNLDSSMNWTPEPEELGPAAPSARDDALTADEGLGLDWSDAVESGYQVTFNEETSFLEIPVGRTFSIDPTTVATATLKVSPLTSEHFEGEKRTVSFDNTTFAFYYDGSNIKYKTSTDYGKTWGSAISTGSGVVASDYHRWTLVTLPYQNVSRIVIVYWTPDDTNMNFQSVRGTVNGTSISWDSPVLIGYTAANAGACGSGGACAASTATVDNDGNIYAAFTWKSGGATQFAYKIMKSANAGESWSYSLNQVSSVSNNRPSMALTVLNSTQMFFAYGLYELSELKYRIFDGSSWGSEQTTNGAGMSTNVRKQISAASNSTQTAYVAFTNGGVSGDLKVAIFSNTGSFEGFETADDTLSHALPSITITKNDAIHISSIADSKIYETRKFNNIWKAPSDAFRTTFSSLDQLTAEANNDFSAASLLWTEDSSPYDIQFGIAFPGVVSEVSTQLSPSVSQYYAGERRVADVAGTVFAFYYDGANIAYRTSVDGGSLWSNTPASTGTGQIGQDDYRWSLIVGNTVDSNRITLLYYKPSGNNTDFFAKTFSVNGTALNLVSTDNLFSVANDPSCGSNDVCAAASGAIASDSSSWAVYRYKTGGDWYYRVFTSSDVGDTWTSSLGPVSVASFTSNPLPITLTPLASGKMLLVMATYEGSELRYRVYDGSTWNSTTVLSGTGMATNNVKQISADSNSTGFPFIAYVSGGTSGNLKVASFSNSGSFQAFETADNTLSHSLPSAVVTTKDSVRIYSLSDGIIYKTEQADGAWETPVTPFGVAFNSPDQLTAGVQHAAALWRESSSAPHIVRYGSEVLELANEYLKMIVDLNEIALGMNGNSATTEQISYINSTLLRLKEIVIDLQHISYDGVANATRSSPEMVGTVKFYDEAASNKLLFERKIPQGTLGIFAAVGLNEELSEGGFNLSSEQFSDLLGSSSGLAQAIANFEDDEIASNFVLAGIGRHHPSTGDSFAIIPIIVLIGIDACLNNEFCRAAVEELIVEGGGKALEAALPYVAITGVKFNDLNGNGVRDNQEPGLSSWEFTLSTFNSPFTFEDVSDSNGTFVIFGRVPATTATLVITETLQSGWESTTGEIDEVTFEHPGTSPFFEDPFVFENPQILEFGNHVL